MTCDHPEPGELHEAERGGKGGRRPAAEVCHVQVSYLNHPVIDPSLALVSQVCQAGGQGTGAGHRHQG